MISLTPFERALRRALVQRAGQQGSVDDPVASCIEYGQLRSVLPVGLTDARYPMTIPPFRGLNEALGHVSTYEAEHGRPMLSAIVVNKDTRMPGEGFAALAARLGRKVVDERTFWIEELASVVGLWTAPDPILLFDGALERVMRELVTIKERLRRIQPAEDTTFLSMGAPGDGEFLDWFVNDRQRLLTWAGPALAARLRGKVISTTPQAPLAAIIEVRTEGAVRRVGMALATGALGIMLAGLKDAMAREGCAESYVVGPEAPIWISDPQAREARIHHEPVDRLSVAATR